MYEVTVYRGYKLHKENPKEETICFTKEGVGRVLKEIKWNDAYEIFIKHKGEVKHYISYEEELQMAIDIYK